METKVCSKCGIEKPFCEFYKDGQKKDGLSSSCKICVNNRVKIYKEKNPDKLKQTKQNEYLKNIEKYRNNHKEWKNKNPDYTINYSKSYYDENKKQLLEKQKKYYKSNKDSILKKCQEYVKNNREKTSKNQKEYRDKNKERLQEYSNQYKKERRHTDVIFKLRNNLSHRTRQIFKYFNTEKKDKTFDIIGCSPEFLKEHLENQFISGMTWENKNKWHIDHIIPLSSAKTEDELYKLCHYTNLQPLWAEDNLKKSNKIFLQTI
jgi:hypothetical protein